ncbi:ABC transporter permease [Microbulbifer sp. 2304DJ12-6]|uniref:ABC transporter permease n=1 Tax=Microbulbifer sp. 2304DJ12-6 TaxID=3233340 RepID=UPI0039B00B2A
MINFILPLKNAIRKPAIFWLTCLSIAVAFFLFTVISAINAALEASGTNNNQYRLMTTHKISITTSIPIHYEQKIKALEDVEDVTHVSWFGGFFRDETSQLQALAVEPESYWDIYPEYQLTAEDKVNWKRLKSGVVVGRKLADRHQWNVGDKVPIQSTIWINNDSGSFTWEVEVSAIYHSATPDANNSMLFLRHDFFDEARGYGRYNASWLVAKARAGSNTDSVSRQIDELFASSPAATRTTTEQVFIKEQVQQFVNLSWVLRLVVLAVFFTLLLIASNSMSQSVRERMNELAMMKSLGFSSDILVTLVCMEALYIILAGAIIGVICAVVSVDMVQVKFTTFLPGIHIDPITYWRVGGIAVVLAAVCSLTPAIHIYRLGISQTLRA